MPFSFRRPLCRAAWSFALLGLAGTVQAADWNEAVNGDLSGDGLVPTVLSVAAGSNAVRGTTGREFAGGPVDRDYFTLTVPAGHELSELNVLAGTLTLGDGSFIGLMSGSTFTVPPTTQTANGLLGWTLFNENNIGDDLLGFMSTPNFGSSGFSPPLPAGSYSFWVQETAVGVSTYALSLTVTAVPEPATALFMLGGLAALAAARKRR
jgi:PEP-CTERM motif